MSKVSIKRLTFCAALLAATAAIGPALVESAEPPGQFPEQKVRQYRHVSWNWFSYTSYMSDTPPVYECLEVGDIPLAPWDRTGRVSGLNNRWIARHEEKKAWHYYIRGVGPAVHERSPGRPCLW